VLQGRHPENVARFRLTNSGVFGLHADIWLKSAGEAAEASSGAPTALTKQGGPKGLKGGRADGGAPPPPQQQQQQQQQQQPAQVTPRTARAGPEGCRGPFALGVASIDLSVEETAELEVFALPAEEGVFEDVVVVRCGPAAAWGWGRWVLGWGRWGAETWSWAEPCASQPLSPAAAGSATTRSCWSSPSAWWAPSLLRRSRSTASRRCRWAPPPRPPPRARLAPPRRPAGPAPGQGPPPGGPCPAQQFPARCRASWWWRSRGCCWRRRTASR
jgi:hypothetical protein